MCKTPACAGLACRHAVSSLSFELLIDGNGTIDCCFERMSAVKRRMDGVL
jgi:hypothetical protein